MIKKINIDSQTRLRDIGEWIEVDLVGGAENAFAAALVNPYTVDLIITEIVIRITTEGATAAATMDVDVVDAATDTAKTIFEAIPLDATAPLIYSSHNVSDAGTAGNEKPHLWEKAGSATGSYVTAKILDAAAAAMVGKMYIHVIEAQ